MIRILIKNLLLIVLCSHTLLGEFEPAFIKKSDSQHDRSGIAGKKWLRDNKEKRIAVIGTGYVGLVTGAGLAEFGNTVVCADILTQKIARLKKNIIPIYEPGLEELVMKNVAAGRLTFTSNVEQAIADADVIFLAVSTPMNSDGSADMSAIESVIKIITKVHHKYQIIVTKSTVPIGTGKKLKQQLLAGGLKSEDFDIVSNPEFLREGSAVHDFLKPDRIVIGTDSVVALEVMCSIYNALLSNNVPHVFTNVVSAEMIKYATNAFLAIKLSVINEIANLCDKTNADVKTVAYAMGLDHRISPQFLNPGPGFGGSCFLKDAEALLWTAKKHKVPLYTVHAALTTNKIQQLVPVKKLLSLLNCNKSKSKSLQGKVIAVLGLAFKANTDDIRCSPACVVVRELIKLGAAVKCYDPAAMANAAKEINEAIYCEDPYSAVKETDAIVVMTEWDEFKQMDWTHVAQLVKNKVIVDARNILNPVQLKSLGFVCDAIGQSYLYKNKNGKRKIILPMYRMVAVQ